jgi:hypothetical protein
MLPCEVLVMLLAPNPVPFRERKSCPAYARNDVPKVTVKFKSNRTRLSTSSTCSAASSWSPPLPPLVQNAEDRYAHSQVFVRPEDFECGTAAEKQGIAKGHGGTWQLGRAGQRVNPETTPASGVVGWHSDVTVKRMKQENTVIPPREHVVHGKKYVSPHIKRHHHRDRHMVGGSSTCCAPGWTGSGASG